jgi:DnaJ-class molecular chaperone
MMTLEERQKFEEISEAVEILNVKKYTPEQLRAYDLYLDNIRVQETGLAIAKKKGREEGRIEGRKEGRNGSTTMAGEEEVMMMMTT